jgi:two-component system sensor histidine kinase PilS (NtrC family)
MDWHQTPDQETSLLVSESTGASILPQFTRLGTADGIGALIFLEDTTVMAQQAQQMKLASLGRLTASIAHEIRNPLGAISHAAQLLKESSELDSEDQRLMTIIRNHTLRVNTVVENVLQLSRPASALPQTIALNDWLGHFTNEFVHSGNCKPDQLAIAINPRDLNIFMDPSQLHQVVWNLCQNAMHHGNREGKAVKIQIIGSRSGRNHAAYLDIIDNGPGIDPTMTSEIFEPFFTTNSSGTGLGLYIAREICESNQARLTYQPHNGGGSCFRISFTDKDRLPAKALA